MGSSMWRTITSLDAADLERRITPSGARRQVIETNGRTLKRRPTRIVPGPPPWVLRRGER